MITPHAFAAIDMGSNTIKVRMWQIDAVGNATVVHEKRHMVRLGGGTFASGQLSEDRIEAASLAMREVRRTASENGVTAISAVATAAMRAAANASHLVERIAQETGIRVEIISPEREGILTAKGAVWLLPFQADRATVVDIGGGSGELISIDGHHPARTISLPLGAVMLTESHLRTDPPSQREMISLEKHVAAVLQRAGVIESQDPLIGCGGTMVSIGTICSLIERVDSVDTSVENPVLSLATLQTLRGEMAPLPAAARAKRYMIERQRSEVIIAGAIALERIMRALGQSEIHVSSAGIREGLLLEHLDSLR